VREDFSGHLVVDEVHDGPYTIFYAVDPVARKRAGFLITREGATEETARRFLVSLQTLPLVVLGITTDGNSIYPGTIADVFPGAKHQVCRFHVLKDLNTLVLRALSQVRRSLRAEPKRRGRRPKRTDGRSRAETAAQRRARRDRTRREAKALAIWENRYLFVKRLLSASEKTRLAGVCRGRPELRALREFVELVYALFDRRCRTATALEKLARLRRRRLFQRFPLLDPLRRKLMSPNIEKALEYLDDRLLEGTSNAAERANRRFRKMQKAVYRWRSERMIRARIIFDMLLDYHARSTPQSIPITPHIPLLFAHLAPAEAAA
jgi:Transposase